MHSVRRGVEAVQVDGQMSLVRLRRGLQRPKRCKAAVVGCMVGCSPVMLEMRSTRILILSMLIHLGLIHYFLHYKLDGTVSELMCIE